VHFNPFDAFFNVLIGNGLNHGPVTNQNSKIALLFIGQLQMAVETGLDFVGLKPVILIHLFASSNHLTYLKIS
jgi:hypothetical protein